MTNGEASLKLADLLLKIDQQIEGLKTLRINPGGPIDERADRRNGITTEIMGLATKRAHVVNRKLAMDVATSANKQQPLDAARASAITSALNAVSHAVAGSNEFHQALQLAQAAATAIASV
jgi:hypothetical protein